MSSWKSRSNLNLHRQVGTTDKYILCDGLLTSSKEYSDFVSQDSTNRVLLAFSRLHFNRTFDKSVFTLSFGCSLNSGGDYAVYVKKEDGKWKLKRIIESAIR